MSYRGSGIPADVLRIHEMLTPKPKELVTACSHRRFIRDGEIDVYNPTERRMKHRHFFLFNDVLLLTKKEGSRRYWLKVYVSLRTSLRVEDVKDTASAYRDEFRLYAPKKTFIFFARTEEAKLGWLRDIRAAINGEYGSRDGHNAAPTFGGDPVPKGHGGYGVSGGQHPSSSAAGFYDPYPQTASKPPPVAPKTQPQLSGNIGRIEIAGAGDTSRAKQSYIIGDDVEEEVVIASIGAPSSTTTTTTTVTSSTTTAVGSRPRAPSGGNASVTTHYSTAPITSSSTTTTTSSTATAPPPKYVLDDTDDPFAKLAQRNSSTTTTVPPTSTLPTLTPTTTTTAAQNNFSAIQMPHKPLPPPPTSFSPATTTPTTTTTTTITPVVVPMMPTPLQPTSVTLQPTPVHNTSPAFGATSTDPSSRYSALKDATSAPSAPVSYNSSGYSSMGGVPGSTIGGMSTMGGSTMGGMPGSTMGGMPVSTMGGMPGSTMGGMPVSTMGGMPGSTMGGMPGSTFSSLSGFGTLPTGSNYVPGMYSAMAGIGTVPTTGAPMYSTAPTAYTQYQQPPQSGGGGTWPNS